MSRPSKFLLAIVAIASLCFSAATLAQRYVDPPGRVARISDMRGYLSYSPAGDGEWYDAHRNRPLLRGDALWSDRGARAEIQAGGVWLRMDGETSVEFLALDDRMLQVEVAEGTINVRIRRMYPGQRVEIDTPNLALVIDRPGNYRIDVDRRNDNTTIEAREGFATAYGMRGRFPVRRGDVIVFYGEDLRDYEMYAFPGQDGFDRYVRMRDQRIDRSLSLRYVGDDLIGFSDLDDYGRWSRHSAYGNVWYPSNVYAGWAPYQDGQWIWLDPWGWTWVDDQPWGFAPSHYGRWVWVDGRWGWLPGSRTSRSIYAPALVAFIEDIAGAIGWFPLGPGDIYYPSYSVSSRYFTSVNAANTSIAAANLGRAYSSYGRANAIPLPQAQAPAKGQASAPARGSYRNRTAPGAVTVVSKDVFSNGRPVREAAQRGRERELLGRGELRRSLGVRPAAAAIRGDAPKARVRPSREVEDQQVFVRNAPPAQQATPGPSAAAEAAPVVRERPRRVRVIEESSTGADVRATTRPQTPQAAAPAAGAPASAPAPSGQLRPLDREAPRARAGRRLPQREQREEATPAPASAPAATPTPAAAPAPAGDAAAERAAKEEARQGDQAREAAQKAREERRQAMEAQRKAEAEQQQAERAQREARQQREQARAEADAQQSREAAQAEAKANAEREQARRAELEAQRQQRESERAQREAQKQQAEATQASATAKEAEAAAPGRAARECVTAERIEAMRKRGVPEERIAALKVCPAEPAPAQQ